MRAVSATFVSAQRAWMLEGAQTECQTEDAHCEFRVFGTVDGGATWKPLGPINDPASGLTLRFADATHGFAFDATQIFATVDGGETWRLLALPFHEVQTVEIARGVVYAIGYSLLPSLVNNFYVWSTPADRIDWSMDPLALPLGAGPVPIEQLTFAGSVGYLLNSDRTVIGGARLSSTHRWVAWQPPCLNLGAPEYLTASSGTNLVALCNEGVWSGPKITPAVYFSNNGGVTWSRRVAPTYGLVASPNPTTAVIAIGQTLWRTTNAGATWQVVSGAHETTGAGAIELGFTTPDQGYAILSGDKMVITHDAGATWAPFGP